MGIIKKRDLILAAILLLAAAFLYLYGGRRDSAARAQVTSGGQVIAELGRNHLIIKDGRIWCSEADCPDKLCVQQGEKSLDGDTIVCLPNQMAVTILRH